MTTHLGKFLYTIWMARQGYIRSVRAGRGGIAVVEPLYVNPVDLDSVQKKYSS